MVDSSSMSIIANLFLAIFLDSHYKDELVKFSNCLSSRKTVTAHMVINELKRTKVSHLQTASHNHNNHLQMNLVSINQMLTTQMQLTWGPKMKASTLYSTITTSSNDKHEYVAPPKKILTTYDKRLSVPQSKTKKSV